ncbi:response regulator [Pseudidiomarina aestuarii]|uniref:response regulator n=1 Tax=Pseudidiomarina aestuarii TaxID=624146 RepID=UPI003A97693F
MKIEAPLKYTFDGFTIDSEQLCIDYQGQLLSADSRVIRLMILLISRSPVAVSQQEVLEALWTGSVVSNWSASRLVADARTFFKSHHYPSPVIETLRGRGYRLAPELARRIAQPTVEQPPTQPHNPNIHNKNGAWFTIAAMFLVGILAIPAVMTTFNSEATTAREVKYGEPLQVIGRILWVDDNPSNNEREAAFFENKSFGVYNVTTTEDALTLLQLYNYDLVISDMGRGDDPLAGMRLLEAMRANDDDTTFILYTIVANDTIRRLLVENGGYAVITNPDTLVETVVNMPFQTSSNRFKDKP